MRAKRRRLNRLACRTLPHLLLLSPCRQPYQDRSEKPLAIVPTECPAWAARRGVRRSRGHAGELFPVAASLAAAHAGRSDGGRRRDAKRRHGHVVPHAGRPRPTRTVSPPVRRRARGCRSVRSVSVCISSPPMSRRRRFRSRCRVGSTTSAPPPGRPRRLPRHGASSPKHAVRRSRHKSRCPAAGIDRGRRMRRPSPPSPADAEPHPRRARRLSPKSPRR